MKNTIYILILGLVIFFGCKKELSLIEQTNEYSVENMVFTCEEDIESKIYFKGEVNGEPFCISYPQNDYWFSNSIFTVTNTAPSATFNTNSNDGVFNSFYEVSIYPPIFDNIIGIHKDFQPWVKITTPHLADSTIHSEMFYLDKYLKEGKLDLRSPEIDKYSGWDFGIGWHTVLLPGYDYYKKKNELVVPVTGTNLTPREYIQNNLKFEISQLSVEKTGNISTYDVTFKIECDLYAERRFEDLYYGRLDNGEFRTQIIIEH